MFSIKMNYLTGIYVKRSYHKNINYNFHKFYFLEKYTFIKSLTDYRIMMITNYLINHLFGLHIKIISLKG